MPSCCSCGKASTCAGCKCAKAGRQCTNCSAGRHGTCRNSAVTTSSQQSRNAAAGTATTPSLSSSCPTASKANSKNSNSRHAQGTSQASSASSGRNSTVPPITSSQSNRSRTPSATAASSLPSSCPATSDADIQNPHFQTSQGNSQPYPSPENVVQTVHVDIPHSDINLLANLADSQSLEQPLEVTLSSPTSNEPPVTSCRAFTWATVPSSQFEPLLEHARRVVVNWRRNVFSIPSGKAGSAFVAELARLLHLFSADTPQERIALKAAMVLPPLVLQKPWRTSKAADHVRCLERRLQRWQDGDITSLLHEGQQIQDHLPCGPLQQADNAAVKGFTRMMLAGKVHAAIRCLHSSAKGGVLPLQADCGGGQSTIDVLQAKHPSPDSDGPPLDTLLRGPCRPSHPVLYEPVNAAFVRATSLSLSGAAGVSGLDSDAWRRMCCSFGRSSTTLCNAVAVLTKRLATSPVSSEALAPLLAGRLVPLDKNPGIRPIGIGETLRRFIAKVVLRIARQDIAEAAGALQTCAGQTAGAEAAAHALCEHFDNGNAEGALLVDATNAFNLLNRAAMLHNIHLLCPPIAMISTNFYRSTVPLHVSGTIVWSSEGTTQGCPLAMPLYALAVVPLITALSTTLQDNHPVVPDIDEHPPNSQHADSPAATTSTIQLWYADDAAAAGLILRIRAWWDRISQLGPGFGYFPNATKSWLVVKPEHLRAATAAFADTNVRITTEGRPYLGAPLGSEAFKTTFARARVEEWASQAVM